MKIAFYVSRNASRLKKFLRSECQNEEILSFINLIVTDNLDDHELKNICDNLNLNLIYLNNTNIVNKNIYSSNFILHLLIQHQIDYLLIYCDTILKGQILNIYENRIINFHPSILPSHKGLKAIDQAITNNTFLLGNTAHLVDKGIDTGPVIMQSFLPRALYQDYDQVLDLQVPMIFQIIKWLNEDRLIIENGRVEIENAKYNVEQFLPNLEFNFFNGR